jgi:hypothetical protein
MAATYTPIASITLGATASSVTFSSIPSTYTDLVLISSVYSDTNDVGLYIRYNSDTASNYSYTYLEGNNSNAAVSGRASSQDKIYFQFSTGIPSTTGVYIPTIINVMNYSNTTTNKTLVARSQGRRNDAAASVSLVTGLWRSTAAITSINLALSSGNFASGSTFNLYGILGANA